MTVVAYGPLLLGATGIGLAHSAKRKGHGVYAIRDEGRLWNHLHGFTGRGHRRSCNSW